MATPVVDVSFTADVQTGEPPLTVNFTDTTIVTNGFARQWLWDFGDGTISEDQNPTHIYQGTGGEKFTVSLAVVATETEFAALTSSTNFGPTNLISNEATYGNDFTNDDAWAARASLGDTGDHFYSHKVSFNGSTYAYNTNDVQLYLKSNSSTLAFVQIRSRIVADIQDIQGSMEIDGGGDTPTVVDVWTVVGRLVGVTTANPKSVLARIIPQVQLGSPPAGHNWGIKAEAGTRTFTNTATQDYGEKTEVDFIQIGDPPIAAFTGFPVIGGSPLHVQFENLSTPATGGVETTYVWKKRLAGTADPFTQFSTAENPLEIFTK